MLMMMMRLMMMGVQCVRPAAHTVSSLFDVTQHTTTATMSSSIRERRHKIIVTRVHHSRKHALHHAETAGSGFVHTSVSEDRCRVTGMAIVIALFCVLWPLMDLACIFRTCIRWPMYSLFSYYYYSRADSDLIVQWRIQKVHGIQTTALSMKSDVCVDTSTLVAQTLRHRHMRTNFRRRFSSATLGSLKVNFLTSSNWSHGVSSIVLNVLPHTEML